MASMGLPLPSNPLIEEIRRREALAEQERRALAAMVDPSLRPQPRAQLRPFKGRLLDERDQGGALVSMEESLRRGGRLLGAGEQERFPGTAPQNVHQVLQPLMDWGAFDIDPAGPAKAAGAVVKGAGKLAREVAKREAGLPAKIAASELKGPALAARASSEARYPEVTRAMLETGAPKAGRPAPVTAPAGAVGHPIMPPGKGELTWKSALDKATDTIHSETLLKGGNSMNPLTGEVVVAGDPAFMVGKYSNQSGNTVTLPLADFQDPKKGRAAVRAFMESHADELANNPDSVVGSWIDGNTVYLDISQRKESARQATVAGMYQRQPPGTVRKATGEWPKAQEAIYDAEQNTFPPVGNFAEFVGSPEFRSRMDEMFGVGEKIMQDMGQPDWWDIYGSSLERVYGKERMKPLAGLLAVTSGGSPPVENLRAASEYLRRMIKGEDLIQPGFRIPETAIGHTSMDIAGRELGGSMGAPGKMLPKEATRVANLQRVGEQRYGDIQLDKMNDMFHALVGEDVGVLDRHWAKIAEAPERGIYAESGPNLLGGSMDTGKVGSYALIENAMRDAAKARGMSIRTYSATVWEGIRDTIRRTGKLFGTEYKADAIPEMVGGFPAIFDKLVKQKADAWGITVEEFEKRLRNGDAELLMAILSAPAGYAAYQQWQQQGQATSTGSQSAM